MSRLVGSFCPANPRAGFIPGEPERAAAAPALSTHRPSLHKEQALPGAPHTPLVSNEQLTNQPRAEGWGKPLRVCTFWGLLLVRVRWQLEPPESRSGERNLHKVGILLRGRTAEWRKQGSDEQLNQQRQRLSQQRAGVKNDLVVV